MELACPTCRTTNPAGSFVCVSCHTPLDDGTLTQLAEPHHWSRPLERGAPGAELQQGAVLAGRYVILDLLGRGGMGAVYRAMDRELDREVALKVIRPELAGHMELLKRFKRELILARQVSHRNVIRIFDLGEAGGQKFISMEFVEGRTLAGLLAERGALEPREAALIFRQVLLGLEAAHAEGVVHRDLKPQNIMVDSHGKVTVMDFGIAGSVEVSGLTRAGALLGTPAYMSPEQAKGEHVDGRSDLFAAGIIIYEVLTGVCPFQASTPMGTLMKRIQERAPPVTATHPATPKALSDVAMRCLETDVERRYQSAAEALEALDAWLEPEKFRPAPPRPARWVWAAAACVILALLAGWAAWRWRRQESPAAHKPVSLLVADFQNSTTESIFSGALEPALGLALEGASFISVFDRADAKRVASQMNPGAPAMDESLARLVAVREGIGAVVAGVIEGQGQGYRVNLRLVDPVSGKVLLERQAQAGRKQDVLKTVAGLAAPVRKTLGDTTPESVQANLIETFTSASVEAAHDYSQGQQLGRAGKWDAAIESYLAAIEHEPGMGRAYAGLAVAYANQGLTEEAEKYYKLALARLDHMSERERHRTRGGYYLMTRNHQKAIEEFNALVARFPADSAGLTDLALTHFYRRDMAKALEEGRKALALQPGSILKRINVALFAMYSGDLDQAETELRNVLRQNPEYPKAMLALGLCQLAKGRPAEAAATYEKLKSLPNRGPDFAAIGLADLALTEGRLAQALPILESGAAEDRAKKRAVSAANKFVTIADVHLTSRRVPQALAAAEQALKQSQQPGILYRAALIYTAAGQTAKAAALAVELSGRFEADPRAYAEAVRAEIRLKNGEAVQAAVQLQAAAGVADAWLVRFALGRAYLAAGKPAEAHSEFERCLQRKGEAMALFLDDLPTFRYYPPVHYFLGRVEETLNNSGASGSFRAFLGFRKSAEDPLVEDARRRSQ